MSPLWAVAVNVQVPLSPLSLYDCGWRCNFCALPDPKKIISAKGVWLQLGLTSSILSGLVPAFLLTLRVCVPHCFFCSPV